MFIKFRKVGRLEESEIYKLPRLIMIGAFENFVR